MKLSSDSVVKLEEMVEEVLSSQ